MGPVVRIAQGWLRGTQQCEVLSFKGIPYAAAPKEAGRFAAPAPAPTWEGVREAVAYGPTAPAAPYPSPFDELIPETAIAGEDYLNLNVWTSGSDSALRPVLVWIHGGGFVDGSGALSCYEGSRFARDGVVCITINYRLGAEGFLLLDGAPANRGLLDQIAALRWVRDNVATFGGDPEMVTIAGESAGGSSVATLLTMPAATGLFRRAIAQSGAGHNVLPAATAALVTTALTKALGVEATAESLDQVPVDQLTAAQAALTAAVGDDPDPRVWGQIAFDLLPFEPVIDGDGVSAAPIDRIAEGASADRDLLIGTTAEEMAIFFVPTGVTDAVDEQTLRAALDMRGVDGEQAVATYRKSRPAGTPGELMIDAVTDFDFRIPAIRMAEARQVHGADTYMYEFCWQSPKFGGRLGACHFLEVGFVFDNLDDPAAEPLTGPSPPQQLADEVHRAWVNFVSSGNPGWAPYGEDRNVHQFALASATVKDPHPQRRRIWEGVR